MTTLHKTNKSVFNTELISSGLHNHNRPVVQQTVIDTLYQEGKPQRVKAQKLVVIIRKLCGRKKSGRKRCKSNRDSHSLKGIVKQSPFISLTSRDKCQKSRTCYGLRITNRSVINLFKEPFFYSQL
ncbi:hypothetical protein XENORESO_003761 [Xenotaenia resolanae]|uniref:Ribosomal protein S12 n=1 Tax=Xenotaenia resolanae TaxID=208358 RepID=A0ABV0WFQ3_9TELE